MWCHSQKYLCSVNYWCCCMSSKTLLYKTNKKWRIKKILIIFQQILIFFLFQYLITLKSRFCLSWMLIFISSAVLIFFWLITCASFCCRSHNYKFLWYLETAMRSHDFHFIRFHELDWSANSVSFLWIDFDAHSFNEQTACCASQSFSESALQWLSLWFFQQYWAELLIFRNVN